MATAGARITFVSSDKWEDDWYVDELDCQQRNLYDFLSEGSHGTFAGLFKLLPSTAKAKTKKPPWRGDKFDRTLQDAFAGHVTLYPGNWWYIRAYVKYNAPENLSPNQAEGIVKTLQSAPLGARVDWWRDHGHLLEARGSGPDRVGIPIEALSQQPLHSSPLHTKPRTTIARGKPALGRKLTDDQNAWKEARLAKWSECLKRYYAKAGQRWQECDPPWEDAGHAVGWFAQMAKRKKYINAAERFDRAIWFFFKRRSKWREEQRAKTPKGEVPPPVRVLIKDFRDQFAEFWDMAESETNGKV